ncbi:hypothetical protein WG906_07720 [Pedobacter sp. P351]|uniref:hypothetical protein n=1 Tax=Pedobacter superstes TaxID=3133441 RepID=UPI003097EF32
MSTQEITPRNDAGRTYINNQKIYWDFNDSNLLEVEIASISAIGEYTTVHALHRNEWFIVFILNQKEALQISAYAQGMQEVLEKLSEILSSEIAGKLAMASDFKSNVIYPEQLAGQELYELRIIESKTWFDRFRARMGFGDPLELVLKKYVNEWVEERQ